jgi:hypothetical protein
MGVMDPESRVQRVRANQALLETAPLTSETEWRKLRIECCQEVEMEETLDCALCGCLDNAA